MKAGTEIVERLLAVQPKSFPFRVQHVQYRVIYADLLLGSGRVDEAAAVMAAVGRELEELTRDQPQISWLKGLGQVQRSNLLIHLLRKKFDPGFEGEAMRLLAETASPNPAVRYNVACLYAQAAALAPPADRAGYAYRAVELLDELLKTTDYFRSSGNANHLDGDTDLDPLRGRDDFRAFVRAAKALAAKSQPPAPGLAPPPREVKR